MLNFGFHGWRFRIVLRIEKPTTIAKVRMVKNRFLSGQR